MTIGDVAATPSTASEFTIKVAENQEDQQTKVINKILSGISDTNREGHNTGKQLNIAV